MESHHAAPKPIALPSQYSCKSIVQVAVGGQHSLVLNGASSLLISLLSASRANRSERIGSIREKKSNNSPRLHGRSDVGEVFSFGLGAHGALGLDNLEDQYRPTKINTPQRIVYIAAGYNQSFAIDKEGKAYSFGANGPWLGHSSLCRSHTWLSRCTNLLSP